jgi:hypothetical protein
VEAGQKSWEGILCAAAAAAAAVTAAVIAAAAVRGVHTDGHL